MTVAELRTALDGLELDMPVTIAETCDGVRLFVPVIGAAPREALAPLVQIVGEPRPFLDVAQTFADHDPPPDDAPNRVRVLVIEGAP